MAQTIDLNCQSLRRNISEGLKANGASPQKISRSTIQPADNGKLRQPKFTHLHTFTF